MQPFWTTYHPLPAVSETPTLQQLYTSVLPMDSGTHGSKDIWVFGYGSLVYRPGFEHAEAVEGYIKGYRRVFWQGSTGWLYKHDMLACSVRIHGHESPQLLATKRAVALAAYQNSVAPHPFVVSLGAELLYGLRLIAAQNNSYLAPGLTNKSDPCPAALWSIILLLAASADHWAFLQHHKG